MARYVYAQFQGPDFHGYIQCMALRWSGGRGAETHIAELRIRKAAEASPVPPVGLGVVAHGGPHMSPSAQWQCTDLCCWSLMMGVRLAVALGSWASWDTS